MVVGWASFQPPASRTAERMLRGSRGAEAITFPPLPHSVPHTVPMSFYYRCKSQVNQGTLTFTVEARYLAPRAGAGAGSGYFGALQCLLVMPGQPCLLSFASAPQALMVRALGMPLPSCTPSGRSPSSLWFHIEAAPSLEVHEAPLALLPSIRCPRKLLVCNDEWPFQPAARKCVAVTIALASPVDLALVSVVYLLACPWPQEGITALAALTSPRRPFASRPSKLRLRLRLRLRGPRFPVCERVEWSVE